MNNIAAIVVTYNRLSLLKENIIALLNQSVLCDIIIVDNASTDGTSAYIQNFNEPRIKYYNTGKNIGGAGGFSYGVNIAEECGYKYLWLMDDDSIPNRDALESLRTKADLISNSFSFISSLVFWTDGQIFPMNVPDASIKFTNRIYPLTTLSKYHLLPIKKGSFVGCFVNTSVSRKIGLPISEFFIYGDDLEYTMRLSNVEAAYLDIDSIIIHKAPSKVGADIAQSDYTRLDRFYFQSRNGMFIAKKNGLKGIFRRIFNICKKSFRIIFLSSDHKIQRLKVLYKGSFDGIRFNPSIKYSNNQ